MQSSRVPKPALFIFRIFFAICAIYFFLMALLMMVYPQLVTKNAGVQHPMIYGIIRGIGGSILGSTVLYILIAIQPLQRRWAALVIACANVMAIALDLLSVHLGEYTLDHAMIDIPVETLSFLTIVLFYWFTRTHIAGTPPTTV